MYQEEQFLQRKKKEPIDWKYLKNILIAILLTPLAALIFYVFVVPHASAEQRYTGVVKDGEIISRDSFCSHG